MHKTTAVKNSSLRRACASLFSIVLALSVMPTPALAAQAITVTPAANSGTIANGTWELTSLGAINISPYGYLPDTETSSILNMPWVDEVHNYSARITSVNFYANPANVYVRMQPGTEDMFKGLDNLTKIDLTGADNSDLTSMSGMFADCHRLSTITIGPRFHLNNDQGAVAYLPSGNWYSVDDERTYTADEITNTRSRVADTYILNNVEPAVTEGNDATWEKGSDEALAFTTNTYYNDFYAVSIDSVSISQSGGANFAVDKATDYTGRSFSTIALQPALLETLDTGEHRIGIMSTTGTAYADFTIYGEGQTPVDPGTEDPNEPDDPNTPPDEPDKPDTPSKPDGPSTGDEQAPAGTLTVHRVYNPNNGEHFYTTNIDEQKYLVSLGWNDEGKGWTAPTTSKTPVFRLYNPNAGDHHYTTSATERDFLSRIGWHYEGICWYSDDDKGVAIYRQYNPNAIVGAHHFTSAKAEYDHNNLLGWRAEGVAWHGAAMLELRN